MKNEKRIFQGNNEVWPHNLMKLPVNPPPWREFQDRRNRKQRGSTYQADQREIDMVNAALYLRRPLLITGMPGVGKSSLAHAVAHELDLGEVLLWSITSKSTRQEGLYSYDALARFQEAANTKNSNEEKGSNLPDIGRYIRLGPIGTAFVKSQPQKPCVVLIDELDKSDIDLPNDLLHLFEEGEFEIPEIARLQGLDQNKPLHVFAYGGREHVEIPANGSVQCQAFPLVIITSNGEREFPPAFQRRCLRLDMPQPPEEKLRSIVFKHLGLDIPEKPTTDSPIKNQAHELLTEFLRLRDKEQKEIATDQLLNAIYLLTQGIDLPEHDTLREKLLSSLSGS